MEQKLEPFLEVKNKLKTGDHCGLLAARIL